MQKSLAATALALALLPCARAFAADQCISQKITDSMSTCPKASVAATVKKSGSVKLVAPAPPKTPVASTPKPQNDAASSAAKELRRAMAAPKSMKLLMSEAMAVETLLAQTPKDAPDRPKLLRRAADDYVELEAAYFREKIQHQSAAKGASAKAEKEAAAKAENAETVARGAAMKNFTVLKDAYPKYCLGTQKGCMDEVLYDLAYEYEQDKKPDQARKVYLQLIKDWPQSKHVPSAYLAFGELFFQEAQSDPSKLSLAEQAYKEVIKYPSSDLLGYAHYKLGYVAWNKGDFAQALGEMKKTIEIAAQNTQAPGARGIADAARRDFVTVYGIAGDAKRAYELMRPLSGDTGGENSETLKMLDALGQAYLDTGHYPDAIVLYQDLMKRDTAGACRYQGHVVDAVAASRASDKAGISAELDKLLDLEEKTSASHASAEQKLACANRAGEALVETAMAWHLEAVGSGGVRGTNDPKTMELAASIYKKVLKGFTAEEFARLEFPRIVKEDWPTYAKVAYVSADLAYARQDWDACAPAFDAVVDADPKGPLAGEALYTSAVCYQNIYASSHEKGSDRRGMGQNATIAPRELTPKEVAMLASFDRFLCAGVAIKTEREYQDRSVEIAYARARTYFDARHFPEAAAAFRVVALDHPEHDAGIYAAQLYLESLNVLASHGHAECIEPMGKDAPAITAAYCKGERARQNQEQCQTLERVERDVEREAAAALVAKGTPEAQEKGAEAYLALWTRIGAPACEKRLPACDRMEEVLENSARAFAAAHLLAKSMAVRMILLDPKYGLDKTVVAKKAVRSLGASYQAIAVYDLAADFYERYARESPELEKSAEALEDATVLWLGLGDEDRAMKSASRFEKQFGNKKPALSAQIAFAIGEHFADHGDYGKARQRLSSAMAQIDRSATIEVQAEAHATLGRALAAMNSVSGAATEYAKVKTLLADVGAAMKRLDAPDQTDAEKAHRAGKMLSALGEALFFFAEEKRKAADKIKFPEYKGSGRRDDVLRFIDHDVEAWMKKKQPAIESAEKEYLEIKQLQPEAPPKWVVAAGSRVGQLWGKFVAEFRAAPVPKEWMQSGPSPYGGVTWEEIRGTYWEAIDKASEPYKQRAKAAFVTCLDWSVAFRHFDDRSRTCETWLSKNYAKEFHVVDELRGAPSWLGMDQTAQPAPLPNAMDREPQAVMPTPSSPGNQRR